MKKFFIVFAVIFILTFAIPFVSLAEKKTPPKKQNELVTIFSGSISQYSTLP